MHMHYRVLLLRDIKTVAQEPGDRAENANHCAGHSPPHF